MALAALTVSSQENTITSNSATSQLQKKKEKESQAVRKSSQNGHIAYAEK